MDTRTSTELDITGHSQDKNLPSTQCGQATLQTCEEEVRLMAIDEKIAVNKYSMIVLDADELPGSSDEKILRAAQWVDDQNLPFTDPDIIVPVILILGSCDSIHGAFKKLIDAGGIFQKKPEGFDTQTLEEKTQWLKDKFVGTSYKINDPPLILIKDEKVDLSIYENPPYAISDEDFNYLVKRMNMPDSDPEKDD